MTYIRNPHNPFMWESDGEYNDKFRADDGTLHNSANDAVKHNERSGHPPAPPVQERESDETRDKRYKLRGEISAILVFGKSDAKVIAEFEELLESQVATAAKQAREAFEKEKWEPWTRDDGTPLICSICGDAIPRCESGWMGDAEEKIVQHMDCGYQQQIIELQAKLAAQPEPQTKEKP